MPVVRAAALDDAEAVALVYNGHGGLEAARRDCVIVERLSHRNLRTEGSPTP